MDRDEYVLFIDETGTASPNDVHSKYYILAGCAVLESERIKIKNWADHIKFKYWGRTDIVFHSREIGRKENEFTILNKRNTQSSFLNDLEDLLIRQPYDMFYVLVDKAKAKELNWDDKKIYKETSHRILESFLCFLVAKQAKGKIVVESATTQKDFYFHQALGNYLSRGIPTLGIKHNQVKDTLTSISFVTKNNYDIEEQIADLLAYAARLTLMEKRKDHFNKRIYEEMVLKVYKKKLLTKAKIVGVKNPKYIKHFDAFQIIP